MKNKLFNKNTVEFIYISKEFVNFCEEVEKYETQNIVEYLIKLLPLLYLKCELLTGYELIEDIPTTVTEQMYESIKTNFERKFGEYDIILPIYREATKIEEIEISPLSELLADIYQDNKTVIDYYQTNLPEVMESALYKCKLNFEEYWGPRLITSLNALHILKYSSNIDLSLIKPKEINLEKVNTKDWIISKFLKNIKQGTK